VAERVEGSVQLLKYPKGTQVAQTNAISTTVKISSRVRFFRDSGDLMDHGD
jgi:hypothetical protein